MDFSKQEEIRTECFDLSSASKVNKYAPASILSVLIVNSFNPLIMITGVVLSTAPVRSMILISPSPRYSDPNLITQASSQGFGNTERLETSRSSLIPEEP